MVLGLGFSVETVPPGEKCSLEEPIHKGHGGERAEHMSTLEPGLPILSA